MKKLVYSFLLLVIPALLISQTPSNALEFDGTDDFVSVINGTALIANLSEFSMCGWVYPTNPNANWPDFDGYFGIKNEGICDFYVVQINGTGIEARITTNTGTYTIDPPQLSQVTLNEWNHYALVYTGDELKLFLNGELDGSIAASGTIAYNNFEITFGKLVFQTNDFYLDGKLDEVTFWDKALTLEEVQQYQCISGDPSSIPNLTAYYNFNEEEGLVLPDYFGNYDGNLTNMTGDEWIISEVCESGYTITFKVTEEGTVTPIENAEVNLEGIIKTTDANGEVEFTNYDPGIYVYQVNADGYYESAGDVTVIDDDVLEEVELAPVLYYSITFVVTQDPGGMPVDSAIVNLDQVLQYTNENGETTFTDYLPGSYTYSVTKEGYYLAGGVAEVIDQDVTVEVSLLISGLNHHAFNKLSVFPNPSQGVVYIKWEDKNTLPIEILISDLSGRKVSRLITSYIPESLDLTGLENGMYIFQAKTGNNIYKFPLIIKK